MRFAVIPSLPAAGRRSEESLSDQNAKKREIPHFADSVRNDEFEVFSKLLRKFGS